MGQVSKPVGLWDRFGNRSYDNSFWDPAADQVDVLELEACIPGGEKAEDELLKELLPRHLQGWS